MSVTERRRTRPLKTVTELASQALAAVFGIRYVVSPWEIPRTVRRVTSPVRVREVEYKTGDCKAMHILAGLLGAGEDRLRPTASHRRK